MKRTAPARLANPFRARRPGELLAMDFSYYVSSSGKRLMVLNLIDEASKFHVAKIVRRTKVKNFQDLGNCNGPELIACLEEYFR